MVPSHPDVKSMRLSLTSILLTDNKKILRSNVKRHFRRKILMLQLKALFRPAKKVKGLKTQKEVTAEANLKMKSFCLKVTKSI